jgi:hypothetical protein
MTQKEIKPLQRFHFPIVQEPLTGLLRNMDSDLKRRVEEAGRANNAEAVRNLTLLLIMLRFAMNSYHAVCFLLADVEDPKRLPGFVLVVPPINRQLMDLWFTLVYMMDDFDRRGLAFEQCGWRETLEQVSKTREKYGTDPEWQGWFEDMRDLTATMEKQIPLTQEQKADPTKVDYWGTPHKLASRAGNSQAFLQFLEQLMYHDASSQSHLKPGGLLIAGSFLLKDMAPEDIRKQLENRTIHQYKFEQFCRTVVALLGIVSEIEIHCKLNNREQAAKVWAILAGYNADAKDVYELRYRQQLG